MKASTVLLLILSVAVASCGGEDAGTESPRGGGIAVPPGPQQTSPTPTGRLTVTVTDPDGVPLANARVNINSRVVQLTAATDRDGVASFEAVPEEVIVFVDHPLGYFHRSGFHVEQTGSVPTALRAEIRSGWPTTVALKPVSIPAGSISTDRMELELRFSIVSSAMAPFVPSSYGDYNNMLPTPYLRLKDCWTWLDLRSDPPKCIYDSNEGVKVQSYTYSPSVTPALPAAQGPYSALLLVDQSRRAREYDPHGLRTLAARRFIRRARATPQADLIAVAGFAGSGGDASSPPLLQQLPIWVPPNTATIFSTDRFGQESALNILEPLVGGSAPLFDALGAAMALTAAQAPATHRPAIVALVGGGDDSNLSDPQRRAVLASLRQQQADTGIQVVLVAGQLDEESAERIQLAELAAALRAPIIFAGYPTNWNWGRDGLYSAMDLAADLLAGSALPTIEAIFRMKSPEPAGFLSGSTLTGTAWVESDICPMGCWELPQQFAVDVP